MKRILPFLILLSCSFSTGNLTVITNLPSFLNEASGIALDPNSNLVWMLNDGGNPAELYGFNKQGEILKTLKIDAENNDWEDLTTDKAGNIYIGDFGNNNNKRKDLAILKISKDSLNNKKDTAVERISFYYPDQKKFPPKKKKHHFDCEAFFHYNDSLYLFTKSREKKNFGKTNMYKIPASAGHHKAQLIESFKTCDKSRCWITSADISADGKQIALLTLDAVWVFTDFENDAFLNGKPTKHDLGFSSQKESVCFIDSETIYITDEKAFGIGGKFYSFKIN